MPCVDGREYDSERETREALDYATSVACEACRILERKGLLYEMSSRLRTWWNSHKHDDEQRASKP